MQREIHTNSGTISMINQASVLHQQGKLTDAEGLYVQVLRTSPNHFDAQHLLGVLRYQQGRNVEALELIGRALKTYPNVASALSNYGAVLATFSRFEDALASYDKALSIKPDCAEALYNRGIALRHLQRFEDALASYDKALAIKPDYVEALNNRGAVLHDLNRFEDSLASYDRSLGIKPDCAEVQNDRSIVLRELGRLDEGRRAAEQAIELAPRKAAYYRVLGDLKQYVAEDSYLAAMEQLVKDGAFLSVHDQIELHFALAKAYEDLGRPEDAFGQLMAGSALKRRQITYDETATLRQLKRICEVFTPELIRTRQSVDEPSQTPIFIVGMPRSGTTLVEQVLASHPQIFGAGELKNFGKSVTELGNGSRVFPDLVLSMPGEQFRQLGENYLAGIKRLAPQAMRITDKMPSNYLHVGLIHLALPNAAIIHTIRDPVDTCVSCFSKLFTEGQDYSYDLAELGRYYRQYRTLMEHWHRVLPPQRILDVHYEDVVADLECVARRMVAHCGLEWDGRCLAFYQTERPVVTASAAQVRQPIYKTSVGRRRRYGDLLAPLLCELGGGSASPSVESGERCADLLLT